MSLKLAPLFQDHAVFQLEQILPIWGWAPSGVRIRAAFAGHEAHTISNNDGDFLLRLPAVPAGGPHVLTVEIPATGEKGGLVFLGPWTWRGIMSQMANPESGLPCQALSGHEDWTPFPRGIRFLEPFILA